MVVFLTVPVYSFGKNSLPFGTSVTVALSLTNDVFGQFGTTQLNYGETTPPPAMW
jgi:hypothetical protein